MTLEQAAQDYADNAPIATTTDKIAFIEGAMWLKHQLTMNFCDWFDCLNGIDIDTIEKVIEANKEENAL